MNQYLLLSVGFEKPTQEIMAAWGRWFESLADRTVEMGGLMNGREISKSGTRALPMDLEAITGYVVIQAESLEEAEGMAQENPFITSIRVYEIRRHGG